MIKESNVQRTVVLPKEIEKKIEEMAKENFCSFSATVKAILAEYFKSK